MGVATIGMLLMLGGCLFDDGPKIVPAQKGVRASMQVTQQTQQGPRVTIVVNKGLEGANLLCGSYEVGPVWLSYGENGQVVEQRRDGSTRSGFRFELGNPLLGNHRTGFQFDKKEEPKLYKRDQSDGSSVEMLNNEKTDAPVMRCFRSLPQEFVWVDFNLLESAPKFVGAWACDGPLGAMSIGENGGMSTGQGPAQAFIWTYKKNALLSVFMGNPGQPSAKRNFDRFFEATLQLDSLAQGTWGYDMASANGQSEHHTCTKQAQTQQPTTQAK
jgi:hypothetical protein